MATHSNLKRISSMALLQQGILTLDELKQAECVTCNNKYFYIDYLVNEYKLDTEHLTDIFSSFFHIRRYPDKLTLKNFNRIPRRYTDELIIPQKGDENSIAISICNPDQLEHLNSIFFETGLIPIPYLSSYTQLKMLLEKKQIKKTENNTTSDYFQKIFNHAIEKKASDIHIEPFSKHTRIRLRIDGILHITHSSIPINFNALINYLKIQSNLDITESRLPQDGRFSCYAINGIKYDCRINFCPSSFGERVVIRILEKRTQSLGLKYLGLEKKHYQTLIEAIKKPQGLILITGPTGSGKTNTLYAILDDLRKRPCSILTIEDPIEIHLPGINQVNVNAKINFNFSTALRAFLRQDPDIIMIGEIRDKETAKIALNAAQTGHLVLATLHCKSTTDAILRLMNMGIQSYQIIESLQCIVSQRLIRKLCKTCKISDSSDTSTVGNTFSHKEGGCSQCTQGYAQRTGIFEILTVKNELKILLNQSPSAENLQHMLQNERDESLWDNALKKIKKGITSYSEICRVCHND